MTAILNAMALQLQGHETPQTALQQAADARDARLSEVERFVQIWSDCESEAVVGGGQRPKRPKPSPETVRARLLEAERFVLAWSDCEDE